MLPNTQCTATLVDSKAKKMDGYKCGIAPGTNRNDMCKHYTFYEVTDWNKHACKPKETYKNKKFVWDDLDKMTDKTIFRVTECKRVAKSDPTKVDSTKGDSARRSIKYFFCPAPKTVPEAGDPFCSGTGFTYPKWFFSGHAGPHGSDGTTPRFPTNAHKSLPSKYNANADSQNAYITKDGTNEHMQACCFSKKQLEANAACKANKKDCAKDHRCLKGGKNCPGENNDGKNDGKKDSSASQVSWQAALTVTMAIGLAAQGTCW